MRLLLLTLLLLVVAVPGAAAQSSVDRAAQALETDPVFVDPQSENALAEGEADALRRRIEAEAPGVLRIAILPGSAGDPRQIARALRSRVGGSVGVVAGNSLAVDGSAEIEAAATAAVEANRGEGPA